VTREQKELMQRLAREFGVSVTALLVALAELAEGAVRRPTERKSRGL